MTPPVCQACGKELATYAQWFSEDCPNTSTGHKIALDQIGLLRLEPWEYHAFALDTVPKTEAP